MGKQIYILGGQKVDADKFKTVVKKYQHSKKGQETIKKYKEVNDEKIRGYNKTYQDNKRQKAKLEKKCVNCLYDLDLVSIENNNVTCLKCRQRYFENRQARKLAKNGKNNGKNNRQ